jgi:hypothetical protein
MEARRVSEGEVLGLAIALSELLMKITAPWKPDA